MTSVGQGIPGTFVFTANDPDVVGFSYQWGAGSSGYVPANTLGGTATASLTPPQPSANDLTVTAVDRAGWYSPATKYRSTFT